MVTKKIWVHRRDSAFVYAILESLDGMASFSTLGDRQAHIHTAYREIELYIPSPFVGDVERVLEGMRKKFPILESLEQTGERS